DIKLRLKSGKYVNIEMQVGNLKSIFKRVEYYIDNMIVRQMKGGDDYDKILPVVAIIVFKDTVLPETKRFHCEFAMLEKTEHFELHGLKAVHTLELPKLPAGGGGKLEDWLTFIKSEKREDYMAVVQKSKPMRRALEVLEEASADQRVRDEYVYRVMAIADEKARRAYYRDKAKEDIKKAKEESKAEGKAEGMAEGMAEGVAQGKAEGLAKGMTEGAAKERQKNANAMIAEGIPPETIARITGLSVDKIRKL
ncbi:MAG: Rpn family recombination-promoting nuclease/putative transposase, partial [Chitinispirillia bacterium]|nr:Rpn family recombination-promoting nuclease/putative transposase [Chitinispirillia bacterium]